MHAWLGHQKWLSKHWVTSRCKMAKPVVKDPQRNQSINSGKTGAMKGGHMTNNTVDT